jgi:AcrR family transcriptional regulator
MARVTATADLGLRERKKRATREALSTAALRLALERGLDNVRVEDIAAAAGVSPRTYNNYFSSREEAICALRFERAQDMGDALRDRPVRESLDRAIVAAMTDANGDTEPDEKAMRMIMCSPVLRAEFMKNIAQIERPLIVAIAERTGTDPDGDLFPRLMASTVFAAVRTATEHWLLLHRPRPPYSAVLRESLVLVTPMARSFDRKVRHGST